MRQNVNVATKGPEPLQHLPSDLKGGHNSKRKRSFVNETPVRKHNQEEAMELESFRDEQFSSSRVGTIRSKNTQMNLAHNNNVETIPEVNADNEGLSPPKKKGKSLFGGIFSNLNMNDADAMEDGDGPVKENWQFCVYQMKKKKYQIFRNGISDNLNIPVGPEDETLIMCINFREKELKTLLIDKLKVNPIMYYE
mmetsp:Transcript_27544/g.31707  ORF Transcript_27544/g.31707 Transcript_27544/m.31707 type:complete len:195 (+) Transcript_27544:160-744(+)